MRLVRTGITLGLVFLVGGCATFRGPSGYLRDPNNDLSDTRTMPELKSPPGIPILPTDPYFVVNQVGNVPAAINISLIPPGSLAALQANANLAQQGQVSPNQTDVTHTVSKPGPNAN